MLSVSVAISYLLTPPSIAVFLGYPIFQCLPRLRMAQFLSAACVLGRPYGRCTGNGVQESQTRREVPKRPKLPRPAFCFRLFPIFMRATFGARLATLQYIKIFIDIYFTRSPRHFLIQPLPSRPYRLQCRFVFVSLLPPQVRGRQTSPVRVFFYGIYSNHSLFLSL